MYRPQKVASSIKKHLSPLIAQIGQEFSASALITRVDVGADLKNATVWVSVYGNDQQKVMNELHSQSNSLSHKLAMFNKAKFSPRLTIKQDSSLEYVDRINRLL